MATAFQFDEQQKGVIVTGEATSTASPDAVELLISIAAGGQTVPQALSQHAARTLTLMQTLTAKGITQNEIRTVGLNVLPMLSSQGQGIVGGYQAAPQMWMGYGDVPPSAYHVNSTVRVSLHDPNRVAELVDAIQLGVRHATMAIWYRVSDEAAVRRAALDRAIKDARLNAQTAAAAVGRQLGAPVSIVEDGQPNSPTNGASVGAPTGLPHTTVPGEIWIRATVRVKYELQ